MDALHDPPELGHLGGLVLDEVFEGRDATLEDPEPSPQASVVFVVVCQREAAKGHDEGQGRDQSQSCHGSSKERQVRPPEPAHPSFLVTHPRPEPSPSRGYPLGPCRFPAWS